MVFAILLDQSKPLSRPQQGLMIAVFLGLNFSLNMIGKFVLGTYGFRFAVTLTICHLVSTQDFLSFLSLLGAKLITNPVSILQDTQSEQRFAVLHLT